MTVTVSLAKIPLPIAYLLVCTRTQWRLPHGYKYGMNSLLVAKIRNVSQRNAEANGRYLKVLILLVH